MRTQRSVVRTLTIGMASALLPALLMNACGGGNNSDGGTNPSPPPAAVSSLSVNPTSVVGGTAAQGTVTLNSAPNTGTAVTLSSNNPAATVPASVTVNASATSASFNIATTAVATATPVTIAGTLNGTQSATLMLTPVAGPPPVPFTAKMTIKSLTAAFRKTNNGNVPVTGKGAGSEDTCPLVPDNNNTPQLSCEFDGGPSTSPIGIKGYRWSWKVGNAQADGQNNAESKFQPKVSNCGFFSGQGDGTSQVLQMVVTLTITDNSNNTATTTNQNVSVFPAGLCGYNF